jgi:predicted N-acyltransferase
MLVKTINPIEYPNWDEQIQSLDGSTIFHTAAWAKVLAESYGYRPTYFVALQDSQITACLPVMDIKSLLTGCRGVSLPFTDGCSPICRSSEHFEQIWRHAIAHGKKARWKFIELRGEHITYQSVPVYDTFYVHTIDLDGNDERLKSKFRSSTKRNINKAIKSGVAIRKSFSLESVKSFYKLNCLTRKRHGLPPQPLEFFLKLHEHIIEAGMGFVLTAIFNGMVIAAAVFFYFHNTMLYKFGASNHTFQRFRPNNLIMWEAIKDASQSNLSQFHFGRTDVGNSGLLQFKRGWGATETSQKYYRYTIAERKFSSNHPKFKSSYTAFEVMPMPFLKIFGKIIYRHVG